ncbi:unnamed protein product [Pleuronectes platessa]|uniref:Uncharacterized protein n=1 Tax=Pleuronectes platessa TaxID=8262 RepID=A0A9N7VXM7_PLEPL|nr:unnamed protein product [Pleuronectes platessa]
MVKKETVWQEPEETRLLHSTHQPENITIALFIREANLIEIYLLMAYQAPAPQCSPAVGAVGAGAGAAAASFHTVETTFRGVPGVSASTIGMFMRPLKCLTGSSSELTLACSNLDRDLREGSYLAMPM